MSIQNSQLSLPPILTPGNHYQTRFLSVLFKLKKIHFSKIHDTKFSILTILSVEFSRVHYIHFATNLYHTSCLPKLKLSPLDNNSPASSPPAPANHRLTFCLCEFDSSRNLTSEIKLYLSFYHRLISLSIISSRFIYLLAGVKFSFLFKAEWYSAVQIDHIWLIHSSIHGHLCYFHFLAMVNSASVNTGIQVSLQSPASILLGLSPKLLNHVVFLIFWGATILFA